MDFANLIRGVIDIATLAVLAWVILSWVRAAPHHPLGRVQDFLDRLINPLIGPIRRVIPPLRVGAVAVDLSPIVLIIALRIIRSLF